MNIDDSEENEKNPVENFKYHFWMLGFENTLS